MPPPAIAGSTRQLAPPSGPTATAGCVRRVRQRIDRVRPIAPSAINAEILRQIGALSQLCTACTTRPARAAAAATCCASAGRVTRGFSHSTWRPASSACWISAAWLLGGVQMSTKSRVSPDISASALSYHRASGQASRNAPRRTAWESIADTMLMSLRDCHPGKCPFAATLPNPMNAPRSTRVVSVEPELTRDGGERFIEDVDAAHGFVLADDQRRVDANDLRIRHRNEAALQRLVEQSPSDGLIQRRLGRAIGDHFDADHQAASADVADEAVFLLQLLQAGKHQCSDPGGIFDQPILENSLNGAKTGRSGQRIAAVARRASARLTERLGGHALEGRGDGTEGKAAADPFADRHDVGLETELFRRPHRSSAAEASQDFIDDEQSVEFIGDVAHGLNEIVRRDDVARRALHRLQDDRCNLVLGVILHDVAQMLPTSP